MAHVNRQYLSEKWHKAKYDMEQYLGIDDPRLPDKIDPKEAAACLGNIREQFSAILSELEKYRY